MSIFFTILSGVCVFVLGQMFLKMFLDPAQKLKETISEIVFTLATEHVTIHNTDTVENEVVSEVYKRLRALGAGLISGYVLIPFYDRIHNCFGLPEKEKIDNAADSLYRLSNELYDKSEKHYNLLDLYRIETCESLCVHDPIKNAMTREEVENLLRETEGNE